MKTQGPNGRADLGGNQISGYLGQGGCESPIREGPSGEKCLRFSEVGYVFTGPPLQNEGCHQDSMR